MNWLREPDGEPLPGYRLLEPIGTGGFGEVWKCTAPGGILKAIKFVYGNLNALDGDDVRAVQEMKALERVKQVRHPFVLSIEQIQDVGGELLIVMELADKNLHECLVEYQDSGRPGIPRDILLGLLDDAAIGLDHLIEKHNLQHLDVKPRNLFMLADRVKVADFGLVKTLERSSSSGLMGGVTPIYAAPETFSNKISKHSDQYSLAIVYIELLTGLRPFAGKNIRQLALQHMTEPPDLSMLPEADRPIVGRALSKNPDDRFPSCVSFIRALAGRSDSNGSGGGSAGGGQGVTDPSAWSKAARTAHDVDLTPPAPRPARGATAIAASKIRLKSKPDLDINESHLLGTTTASRRDPGVLRPTVLIGIGSFGRRALQELRCRLTDRVGDATQVPSYRFLYVDCDPDALNKAISAPPDVALDADDVFQVPLQPVNQYRRKQLDQILDWLPREKLYSIPRSLHAGGSRALGRLAFCDNYLRFVTRLRRDLQVATHPESISASCDQSGLMPRDKVPQVYVFASAAGGSGGMLMDLGYAVKRVLGRLMPSQKPAITAFVFASSPKDPNTSEQELANLYAGVTELNHYADPEVTFTAHYGGPEGPKVEGQGLPFSATYLLTMKARSVEAFRDVVSHLAGYVAHDMTTPLGKALEKVRLKPPAYERTPFRTFGTYGVWFPRGLMLRTAAQRIALTLLKAWRDQPPSGDVPEVEAVVAQVTADERLRAESVQYQLDQEFMRGPDGAAGEQIERWLTGLEAQISPTARSSEASKWSRSVWDQARDLIGSRPTNENDSTVSRSRLSKVLEDAIKRAAEVWANEFAAACRPLEAIPGRRLGLFEAALKKLSRWCVEAAAVVEKKAEPIGSKTRQARNDVQAAFDACQAGSRAFSFFGNRPTRSMKHFLEQLRVFARLRLQEDMGDATIRFYRTLRLRVEDKVREMGSCRARLDQLLKVLEDPLRTMPIGDDTPYSTSEEALQRTIHPTNTLQVVLPNGETHIDRSAKKIVQGLRHADMQRLETAVQKLVLEPRGGLISLCELNADMMRTLVNPLVEQTTAFLGDLLPETDVTDIEASAAKAKRTDPADRVREYHRLAAPPVGAPQADENTFVLVPDSKQGKDYAALVKQTLHGATTLPVNGSATDLMFCREHGALTVAELAELLADCQDSYYAAIEDPQNSPHSRHDVTEWLPITG
ncbi:tubulin-like doman-containing protein [Gemmata sp.]|uniref:tubulin-like doman-containing protein n=1 Tax=Gemmata sp. TaxID=1914242 RepID=UPI003F70A356